MNIHRHVIRKKGNWRGYLWLGQFCLSLEVSTRWRSGFIARWGYGGQERFLTWCLAIPRLMFLHAAIETPFKWHRLRPWDGKYGEAHREFGVGATNGVLRLYFGHDAMGTWYGTHGRWGWFTRGICKNLEVALFRVEWITGKNRYTREVLEAGIPVTVEVGQWTGDTYHGTAERAHSTWKNRFRTIERDDYTISMTEGIPFPGKGENSWDCGDDAYYGFGGSTIDKAVANIVTATIQDRTRHGGPNWRPEGVVI